MQKRLKFQSVCAKSFRPGENSPFVFPCLSCRLADLKAKPDANHANAHPMHDWSCQICNQHRAMSPARGSGFKSDTTRPNLARANVIGWRVSWPRF